MTTTNIDAETERTLVRDVANACSDVTLLNILQLWCGDDTGVRDAVRDCLTQTHSGAVNHGAREWLVDVAVATLLSDNERARQLFRDGVWRHAAQAKRTT